MDSAFGKVAEIRSRFGRTWRHRRRRALAAAARSPLTDPKTLLDYHETLLFAAAYPDDRTILSAVHAELRRVAAAARAMSDGPNRRAAARLVNCGIAGTVVESSLSIDAVEWLCRRFGRRVEPAWEGDSLGDALEELLPILACRVERDGLASERLTFRQWIRLAVGKGPGSELTWLVHGLRQLNCEGELLDRVFDALDLSIRWDLGRRSTSRTWTRFPLRPPHFQSDAVCRDVALDEVLPQPLPKPRRLTIVQARQLVDIGREALCVRQRETDPLTYANPREVTLFSLERGIDVALFGMVPERRLPIESYFGFVMARNRVPIGYGGGWVLFDRCEIGVNIFDTFRGGESAHAFAQIMRVYHYHYGARRFRVDPYQFGAGNPEAIRSGAFWFYHRLGFRPVETRLGRLADDQWGRIRSDRGYRSPPTVLRRLAKSTLAFDMDGRSGHKPIRLSDLGLAVTAWISRRFDGDRRAAGQWASAQLAKTLGPRARTEAPPNETVAFEDLAVLVALIPDLDTWSANEKEALVTVMRAKGGTLERAYTRALQRHDKLRNALESIAAQGADATVQVRDGAPWSG